MKNNKKRISTFGLGKRTLPILLMLALIAGLIILPNAISASDELPILDGGIIQSFEQHDHSVDVEIGASEQDVISILNEQIPNIPAVVAITDSDTDFTSGLVPVAWEIPSDGDAIYDGDKEGEYEFTAVVSDDFDASGISLPTATVIVKEQPKESAEELIEESTKEPTKELMEEDAVKELPREKSAVMPFAAPIVPFASATSSVTIGGNAGEPLKAKIFADGRQQVWLQPYDFENRQFFSRPDLYPSSENDPSAGWILHLYETNTTNPTWSVGRGDTEFLTQLSQNNSNIIYNGVALTADGRGAMVSMTIKYKGSSTETIDILLTYHIDQGSRQMPVTVQLVNHTSKNFYKMDFLFAEDSYFGESLNSIGNYNAMANMVYVRAGSTVQGKPTVSGIMSITGSAATPFNKWDIRDYNFTNHGQFLKSDQLNSPTSSPGELDTVLAAGWGYNNFNSGDTINISYYETWTDASDIQVLPPAGKTVPPEAHVNYEFHIINLTSGSVTTSGMTLISEHGWTARLTGGSQNITIASGGTATVTAELIVPPDSDATVFDGAKDNLTLTVTAKGKQSSGTTTTTVKEDMPALNITKVGQTATTVTFKVDFINYDNPHDTTVSILDMDGKVLGTALNVEAQTTPNFVSGGYFTFDITKLTMGKQYMAEANAQPDIPYPARTTFRIEPVYTVTFDKNANDATDPAPATKTVITGDAYGDLATTTRAGYKFDGWYTAASDGNPVTKDTIVTETGNHRLFAHWTAVEYEFTFTKVKASDNVTPLPGAKFNLYVCNGVPSINGNHIHSDYDPTQEGTHGYCWDSVNNSANPVVSDSDGKVDFGYIPSGTYLLREVEAPDSYERPLGWWIITVDANETTQEITGIDGAGSSLPPAFISDTGYTNLRLPNYENTMLPLTGSVPLDLTIVAALLLGIALLIFITSRKRNTSISTTKNILRFALVDILVAALIFMTFSIVATGVYAADPAVGSITVHRYEASDASTDVSKLPTSGKPLSGIPFKVQKVIIDPTPATTGDVVYTYEGKAYVLDKSGAYSAHTIATNGTGEAVFSGLPLGLYLVSEQGNSVSGAAAPLLVGIPTVVSGASGSALYDIDIYPKVLFNPPGDEPKPDDPEEPIVEEPDVRPIEPIIKPIKPIGPIIKPINPSIPEENDKQLDTADTPFDWSPGVQGSGASGGVNKAHHVSGPHEVESGKVPFGDFKLTSAWSLLSLIMSLIAIIISVILVIVRIVRRRFENDEEGEYEYDEYEEEKTERRNAFITRILTVIFGILTPIVFLILDDMRLPMVWINKWTPYVGLAFIIHIVLLIIYKIRNNKEEDSYEYEVEQSS